MKIFHEKLLKNEDFRRKIFFKMKILDENSLKNEDFQKNFKTNVGFYDERKVLYSPESEYMKDRHF